MQRKWRGGVLFSLIFSLLLTGCGSGGDSDAPITPAGIVEIPEGLWSGTTSNGRTAWGAVIGDGTYWVWYSFIGDPASLGGIVQGRDVMGINGSFTGLDAVDIQMRRDLNTDYGHLLYGVLTGQYVKRQTLNGTLNLYQGGSASFTLTYDPTSEEVPDVARLAGTYPGLIRGSVEAPDTLTVSPSGEVTIAGSLRSESFNPGVLSGRECMTGVIVPRPRGNVYDFTITSPVDCNRANTYRGVAVFDAATNKLSLVAIDPDRRLAFLYAGMKQ